MAKPKIGTDGALFKCPICRKLLPNTDVPTFPFCSERCRLVDLGNWLDGKYVASRPLDPTDQTDELPRATRPEAPRAPEKPDAQGGSGSEN